MKKINFNNRYGLTQAVIEGRKTMTRRIEGGLKFQDMANSAGGIFYNEETRCLDMQYEGIDIFCYPTRYKVGEVVAVAQDYFWIRNFIVGEDFDLTLCDAYGIDDCTDVVNLAGWNNKSFIKAELMPHRIRITGVRCEQLQDISDEDCLKEGINASNSHEIGYGIPWVYEFAGSKMVYYTPREAFAALIDKVSGRGTWGLNPWVMVYEFELVK